MKKTPCKSCAERRKMIAATAKVAVSKVGKYAAKLKGSKKW